MTTTRLTDKKIEDVISQAIGEDAVEIVRFLKGKRDVSEFTLATKTNADIQRVRNILYRLHNENLVSYNRKKDRVKGWYVSYWTFKRPEVKVLMDKRKAEKLLKFRDRLVVEEDNLNCFFLCPNACARIDFSNATNFNFRCPECGSLLNQQDNTRTIEFIKKQIKEMETA